MKKPLVPRVRNKQRTNSYYFFQNYVSILFIVIYNILDTHAYNSLNFWIQGVSKPVAKEV